jgi:SAM-dependent methyltransferase
MSAPASSRAIRLVCPVCRAGLDPSFCCTECDAAFPQPASGRYVNLLHERLLAESPGWADRQAQMERWYADLAAAPSEARNCYARDYEPFREILAGIAGAVLDLGGGIGLTRDYLPRASEYLVADPSLTWLEEPWHTIAQPRAFIRAVGECLPFEDSAFDAVLSLWSLNHVSDPERVIAECGRVLKPGGLLLLVLEDMPPRWPDVVRLLRLDPGTKWRARWMASRPAWSLQADHIRLKERRLRVWFAKQFQTLCRERIGPYLTFRLQRIASR